ncbi:MAG: helix-turn-helix domain-containing protein [bacterium]|nr:helix-turn-helix domain-containing protein [bacterium]
MHKGRKPFSQFGNRLQELRRDNQESVFEVAAAVEIDTDTYTRMEQGLDRPSEDILLLLINHFDIKDDEADELWDAAGYNQSVPQSTLPDMTQIPTMVVIPSDNRIIYTDTANVSINNFGVVMNFMQTGAQNHQVSVSRVGMSLEHAKSILEVLSKTISQAESAKKPKQLSKQITVSKKKRQA